MESIYRLLEWASSKNIILNGIEPRVLPGRGIGIVSSRDIKVNPHQPSQQVHAVDTSQPDETILTVPNDVLRRLDNTPKSIRRSLEGATVHSILACSLAFDLKDPPSAEFEIWRDVMPSRSDISTSMPLCWSPDLQTLLPQSGQSLLKQQQIKFEKDWSLVTTSYADLDRDSYLYAWLLVNTRTFYHTTPKTKKELPKEDHMVLQPVADLFNHSPQGCSVGFTHEGFTITTTMAAKKGEEMFIRYGSHSNDFLLVEYGFILPSDMNSFDEISLDAYILPLLSEEDKEMLESKSFLGSYMLDAETICYRTQVALRAMCLSEAQWLDFLDGQREEEVDQVKVDVVLAEVLSKYQADIARMKKRVNDVSVGDVMRNMLRDRWQQIQGLVDAALVRIEDRENRL